ncbi:MAG: hypothetical protein F6K56_28495 [Moorea sp. SIO3G5]|nr:hypothetical protein [Moorena sp. SIO3G5]
MKVLTRPFVRHMRCILKYSAIASEAWMRDKVKNKVKKVVPAENGSDRIW